MGEKQEVRNVGMEDLIKKSKDTRIPADDFIRPAFRCRKTEWEEFKAVCEKVGVVPSKMFRAFMRDFIERNK